MRFSNYYNREGRNQNIYSRNNLLNMSLKELLERELELAYQYNTIGIPEDEELESSPNAQQYMDEHGLSRWRAGADMQKEPSQNEETGLEGNGLTEQLQSNIAGIVNPESAAENPSSQQINDDIEPIGVPQRSQSNILDGFGQPATDNLADIKDKSQENNEFWQENSLKKSTAEDELDASGFEPELDSEELPKPEESIETPEVSESNETDTEPYLSYEELQGLDAPVYSGKVSKDRYLEPADLMPELAEKAPASELSGLQPNAELEKDVPAGEPAVVEDSKKMTIGAKLQAFIGKHVGVGESNPEQEYYKISLNLDKLKKSKELSPWFTKHNELMTVQDVKNESLNTSIKETVARAKNVVVDKLDQNLLDNTDVVVSKPNSPLTRIATQSPDLRNFVEKHIDELKSGKTVSGSFEFQFETAEDAGEIKKNKASMSRTLHNTNVTDMKMNKDGTISMVLVDYYDFASGGGHLNNNAYKQQENGVLQNYVLLVPIRLRL